MPSVEECRTAVDQLSDRLADVDPELRAKHVPARTVACRVTDLAVVFIGRIDEFGVHDVKQVDEGVATDVSADVRLAMSSDVLLAIAAGEDDMVHAWLKGRVQLSASVRDMLRLRSLIGF